MIFHENETNLPPLREDGVNRGVERRNISTDYTMDEVAVYNNEFDSDSRLVMQEIM